jgi:hypothetical protein
MAAELVQQLGPVGGYDNGGSLTVTTPVPIPTGHHLVLCYQVNTGFLITGGLTISDSGGNTWQFLASELSNHITFGYSQVQLVFYGTRVTNGLLAGDSITVTTGYPGSHILTVFEVSGLRASGVFGAFDRSAGYNAEITWEYPDDTPYPIGTGAVLPTATPEFYLAVCGHEYTDWEDSTDETVQFAATGPALAGQAGLLQPGFSYHEPGSGINRDHYMVMSCYAGQLSGTSVEFTGTLTPDVVDPAGEPLSPLAYGERSGFAMKILGFKLKIGGGIDLAEASNGWLFRAHQLAGVVRVDRSLDAAANWTSQILASDAAEDSPVALVIDRFDWMAAFYHTDAGAMRIWQAKPQGPWANVGTVPGLTNPAAAMQRERMLLAVCNGTGIGLYESTDLGASVTFLGQVAVAVPQTLALRVDRRNVIHLLYRDAFDRIIHTWSQDGVSWPDPQVFVASSETPDLPGFATGIERGFFTYFANGTLTTRKTTEGYTGSAGAASIPSGLSFAPIRPGLLWTRREELLMVTRDGVDVLHTRYSRDRGATWQTPV